MKVYTINTIRTGIWGGRYRSFCSFTTWVLEIFYSLTHQQNKQQTKTHFIIRAIKPIRFIFYSITHIPKLDMVNAGKIFWVKLIFDHVKYQCISKNQNYAKAIQP